MLDVENWVLTGHIFPFVFLLVEVGSTLSI